MNEKSSPYDSVVTPEPIKNFRELYIPPEGMTAIQEFIDLHDGFFEFGNLIGVMRQFENVLEKLKKIFPDLLVDLEGIKENANCIACSTNIVNRLGEAYIGNPQLREVINELICSEPYLLSAVRELNNLIKRQNYLYETVHHVPKRIGAWKEFLTFLRKEKLAFLNLSIVDPGPQSQVLHVYIVPHYRPQNLL